MDRSEHAPTTLPTDAPVLISATASGYLQRIDEDVLFEQNDETEVLIQKVIRASGSSY